MNKKSLPELHRLTASEFQASPKLPVTLVLDNIRSALNIGSAFRTADAFLVEKIWLCGITATPPHREILKTALGATQTVAWEYASSTLDAVKALQKENYEVIAIEQAHDSALLSDFEPKGEKKYALIFGNEVGGVADAVVEASDQCIEIPQFGTKHSLNISVCVGIVVWHFWKKMKQ